MPMTDLPTNPFWVITTGSHQIAFILAAALLVASVYYASKRDKVIHAISLGAMAAVSGLLSYGLLASTNGVSSGTILLAVVLSSILAIITFFFVYIFARKSHWTIVFGLGVVSTMSLGFALEMSLDDRTVALAASNMMLWFAGVLLLAAIVAKFWPSKKDQTEAKSYKQSASFEQPLETSPN